MSWSKPNNLIWNVEAWIGFNQTRGKALNINAMGPMRVLNFEIICVKHLQLFC